ncbi:histidine kinase [Pedobacter sp. ISL-64]|nr:histidine kinase [Pedobacter sp. ISL-64]
MITKLEFLKKHRLIIYHISLWLGYIVLTILAGLFKSPKAYSTGILYFFFTYLPDIYAFYLCWYIYSLYTYPLKAWRLIIGLIFAHASYAVFWYITGYYIRPFVWPDGPTPRAFQFFDFITLNLYKFIKYALLSFSLFYFRQSIKREKELKIIEKEKFDTENAFLRAQINPHFLNNTLNFFFAKSLPLSQELADGIMTLSKIMRYSLEMDKDDRMTLIEEEIEHIKNVIKINQLRFNNKLQIDFSVNGNTDNVRLIPLILITVVENILKHGNCTDNLHPVKIALSINETDHHIRLSTWNKKKKGPKELSSGIGMENIKKRLANHYKKGVALNINETEIDYSLELTLPYNKVTDHQEKPSSSDNLGFLEHFKIPQIKPQPYAS